jgi:23S rRNA (uracil1939-C5)-methyltransferase
MHEVTLESLAFGGDAVGRIDGKVVFVPFGAPGDRVRLRLLKQSASYCSGEILEVIDAGPARRDPACPHFGVCGGCQWQHIVYDAQAAAKTEVFAVAMAEAEAVHLSPVARAPLELGYRRRVRWHFTADGGQVVLGYFRRRSQELLAIERCLLLVDPLQKAMERCRDALAVLKGARGSVVALAGGGGDVHLSVRLERGDHRGGWQVRQVAEPAAVLRHRFGAAVERRACEKTFGGLHRSWQSPVSARRASGVTPLRSMSARVARGFHGR